MNLSLNNCTLLAHASRCKYRRNNSIVDNKSSVVLLHFNDYNSLNNGTLSLTWVARQTRIVSTVAWHGTWNDQFASLWLSLGEHTNAATLRIVDYTEALIPIYKWWRSGCFVCNAREIYVVAALDENFTVTKDFGTRN